MCGRFENTVEAPELYKRLHELISEQVTDQTSFAQVNIAPSLPIQTIVIKDGKLFITSTTWGIKFSDKSPLIINSRIETIKEKPYWKKLFDTNRSLIPMSAYYEWKKTGKFKQPYRISVSSEDLFFVPAISIKIKGSDKYYTSLVTTVPNKFMQDIHHRMPVILTRQQIANYFELPVDELIEECLPLDDEKVMMMLPAQI